MSAPRQTIHFNNRRYDASTGMLLDDTKPLKINPSLINDFVRPKTTVRSEPLIVKPVTVKPSRPKSTHRTTTLSEVKRKPQKATTLMRPAVKKPTPKVDSNPKTYNDIRINLGAPHKKRLQRASQVAKSPVITKFNHNAPKPHPIIKQQNLEVKAPPPAVEYSDKLINEAAATVDKFEAAIENASSHLETFTGDINRSKKGRKAAYVLVSLSVLLIASFGTYQAVPMVRLKLASAKAGFSASLPDYSPSGFGLSHHVSAQPGEIKLSYRSRTDDKSFDITQLPSQWNSQSLLNNFLLNDNKDYQTFVANGKTVYIYDGSNATWVDGGIWYKLEGNASLTNDQLVKIASSI